MELSADSLQILMVTSEAVPFAKTGGLADVVSALSLELSRNGHDVRLVMPRYYSISRDGMDKRPEPLGVPMTIREEWAAVYETTLPDSEVPVYFLDHEGFYGREGIYGPRPDKEYSDNVRRFAFLCRGVFQLCRMLSWVPHILHGHDWVAGLVPYYQKKYELQSEFSNTASVLTIHNLGYQGIFPLEDVKYIQDETDWLSMSTFEFSGALNLLKTGIICGDEITTVSPTYAREIQTPGFGHGLNGLLNYRKEDLTGILNGIDYTTWNPADDPYIKPHNFSVENRKNKAKLKRVLQKEAGLTVDTGLPLVGMVTRLAEQKGIAALCGPGHGSLADILENLQVQIVILGNGEAWCEDELKRLDVRFSNLKAWIGYDERLSHLIEAESDFFLMPSLYEPCGLNQLYSLAYGTLPIVRRTGGLADTVENYNQATGSGTGFVFDDLNPSVLYNVMKWVLETWYNRKHHIHRMIRTGMKLRFSWSRAAEEYQAVYTKALKKKE